MRFLTDKVANGYYPTYWGIAIRVGEAGRVCEVGVDNGHSLEMWQSLFPDGVVVGVDSNPDARWPEGTQRVVSDQADPGLADAVRHWAPYDLIVDDGAHLGEPTRLAWGSLWPLVWSGGWYTIEDWGVAFEGNAPMYDPTMLDTVVGLLQEFDNRQVSQVASVTFLPGLVVIRKQ